MPGVTLEESVSVTNPLLQFAYQIDGILTDVEALEFVVTEIRTGVVMVATTAVDLRPVEDGGDRLGAGRYAPTFQPTSVGGWNSGTHEIMWAYKPILTGPTKRYAQRFEVLDTDTLASGAGYVGYIDTINLIDNTAFACYSMKLIHKAILEVSRQIQDLTGRFFDPQFLSVRFNGLGCRALPLGDPVIGLSKVAFTTSPTIVPSDEVTLTQLRVYNRHLHGLINPDDRDNPRIEFAVGGQFPKGRQNILLEGMFGYTEPDGSPVGTIPARLQKVAAILALRVLQDPFGLDVFTTNPGRIREAKTRDQQVKFGGVADGGVGNLTGDRIVDDILTLYMRPPHYGAVYGGLS